MATDEWVQKSTVVGALGSTKLTGDPEIRAVLRQISDHNSLEYALTEYALNNKANAKEEFGGESKLCPYFAPPRPRPPQRPFGWLLFFFLRCCARVVVVGYCEPPMSALLALEVRSGVDRCPDELQNTG
jgi:hypothetical protein